MPARRVWTIGHSTRTIDEFVALLRVNEITGLADVRTIPRSRRHPHFGREHLAGRLAGEAVEYRHFPILGGLRKPQADSPNGGWKNPAFRGFADHMQTPAFSSAVDDLMEFGGLRNVVVMCAEALWWRCHRMLLSDALVARGVEVDHIMAQGARSIVQPHRLTPFAQIRSVTGLTDAATVWYPALV